MTGEGSEFVPEDELRDLLEVLVEAFDIDAVITVTRTDDVVMGSIDGAAAEVLVGDNAALLDAVQHLATRIVLRGGRDVRVVVDAGGYRARRELALRTEADRVADEVKRDVSAIRLEPMPAAERRFIHEYLRERGDVDTHSEGDEPRRCLVVTPLPTISA